LAMFVDRGAKFKVPVGFVKSACAPTPHRPSILKDLGIRP